MKRRFVCSRMHFPTLLFCWALSIPCAGQSPSLTPPAQPAPSTPTANGGQGPRADSLLAPLPSQPSPTAVPPSPLGGRVTLKPAPYAATDLRFPINLATALRLADARPLIVAVAQARTWVAEAELTRAKVLWIPALNIGFDYIRHDGGGPDFNKGIMTTPSTNFFYAGAGLWGIPLGVISTTDAIYQPLLARQNLNSEHWNIQSAKNDALLQTADAYFMVHQYRGTYAGGLYMVERAREVFERIASLSPDLVSAFEVDRARNMLAELSQQAVLARQEWRVQSARLTKVLRLDPRAVVEPLEHDHLQLTLIDPARQLDDLMSIALANRPEIASRQALVQAAEVGVRREKARPFIPQVALNGFQTPYEMLQAGIFGLGTNTKLNQWAGRDDF
ncbi:MAG: TolC family protein, partial [Isosphaeraceae bacterium]